MNLIQGSALIVLVFDSNCKRDYNFPGTAVGPLFPGFDYRDVSKGERIVTISTSDVITTDVVYFNGGCWFRHDENNDNVDILRYYQMNENLREGDRLPAVIGIKVGAGCVILSGVHPEIQYEDLGEFNNANVKEGLRKVRGKTAIVKEVMEYGERNSKNTNDR